MLTSVCVAGVGANNAQVHTRTLTLLDTLLFNEGELVVIMFIESCCKESLNYFDLKSFISANVFMDTSLRAILYLSGDVLISNSYSLADDIHRITWLDIHSRRHSQQMTFTPLQLFPSSAELVFASPDHLTSCLWLFAPETVRKVLCVLFACLTLRVKVTSA